MKTSAFVAAILISLLTHPIRAQNFRQVLPEGNGVWVVEIETRGGFSGTGGGNFRLSSTGKFSCAQTALGCERSINVKEFQPLIEAVQRLVAVPLAPSMPGICYDCITRTIRITQRDMMGVVHEYLATWDDISLSSVPPEIRRIYEAVVALRR
jgi:hypothetical protein